MRTNIWLKAAVLFGATAALMAAASAQEAVPGVPPTAPLNTSVPHLSYGASQILQLAQAKLGDETIIAFIKNSGNSYRLSADQIIYLRQQGLSDAVVTAMLNQPRVGLSVPVPSTPAPQPVMSSAYAEPPATSSLAPSVTYVQTAPSTTYYYSDPYYYYPGYAWYPVVSFGWGWGWGSRGGGCRIGYGGYHGGWHGGGFAHGGHGGGHR